MGCYIKAFPYIVKVY